MVSVSTDATDTLVLEGIVVTCNPAGDANIAPMGPIVDRHVTRLTLRPYSTSQTLANLRDTGRGVFHIVDNVELLAQAAVGQLDPKPRLTLLDASHCQRLSDCCRWFAFSVDSLDESGPRAILSCSVIERGEIRPFLGFNRAKHAVVEAAILATRIGILAPEEIVAELVRLAIPVEKTAGAEERRAFDFLRQYIDRQLAVS
jgi:uncharacterized protein